MRKMFTGLIAFLMLTIAAQFFLAASAAFDSAPNDESFGPHRALGLVILLIALFAVAVGALAKMPGRVVGRTVGVLGLAVLQPLIAGVATAVGESDGGATAGKIVFGLHGVNGLVIMALVATLVRTSRAASGGVAERQEIAGSTPSGMARPDA